MHLKQKKQKVKNEELKSNNENWGKSYFFIYIYIIIKILYVILLSSPIYYKLLI